MTPQVRLRYLGEFGVKDPLMEDGATLEVNAWQKANYGHSISALPCLADDSGLEVLALNGAPGVRSAHYAGNERNDEANIDLLLNNMSGVLDRRARFRTVLAFVDGQMSKMFEGVVHGHLSASRRGGGGFGYDPIFIPDGGSRTFAEMEASEKNAFSHRAKAFSLFTRDLGLH